jgi:hypothetical protein
MSEQSDFWPINFGEDKPADLFAAPRDPQRRPEEPYVTEPTQVPDWIEGIENLTEESAVVTVIKEDGRRERYLFSRRSILDPSLIPPGTNGNGTNGNGTNGKH